MYRLGIDVGGTNTDAVLLDDKLNLISSAKAPTSLDIQTGIAQSITLLLNKVKIEPNKITHAMLGTTQCTNAIVECKKLARVGVVRLGYPATAAVQPFTAWPKTLIDAVKAYVLLAEYDGQILTEINEKTLREQLFQLKEKVDAMAIIGVFSSIKTEQELQVERLIKEELGVDMPVSLSHQIGSVGFIERENATILNATLENVIELVISGFKSALNEQGVREAKLYLCQNDGTLMSLEYARKFPILTIACGLTNSIRGASYLQSCQDALVLDVGGTTSDVGVISKGSPRESSIAVEIGGIRTNFRMPDIVSVGLGGGSIVREINGQVTIGPDSVGYNILTDALVFGGNTLTTTDIAVRLGMANIGDISKVTHIEEDFAQRTMSIIRDIIAETVDKMKLSAEDAEVIIVGGGSIIIPSDIPGVSKLLRPEQNAVANAIGASIAQASGQYEKIYILDEIDRKEAQGCVVELNKKSTSDTTYLAEGVETGLSILENHKEARVIAVLSKSNFLNVALNQLTDKVVLCLDNDGQKTFSDEIIKKAIQRIQDAGKMVSVVMPQQTGHDFNDVLNQEEVGVLKQQLNHPIDVNTLLNNKANQGVLAVKQQEILIPGEQYVNRKTYVEQYNGRHRQMDQQIVINNNAHKIKEMEL